MTKSAIEEQRIDSFEEWLQYSVGATYDLDTMLSNLSTDEVKEEVKLYAIAVSKQALKNASKNADTVEINDAYGGLIDIVDKQSIISKENIPNLE